MSKYKILIYGLIAILGGLLLSGCNNADTASSSSEDNEEVTQLEINVARLLDTKECKRCNLRNAELADAILEFSDLSNANLSNANLQRSDLQQADLYGANLKNANLSNTKMKNANLMKADLAGADLSDAIVTGTYFFDANLMDAIWTDGSTCVSKSCSNKAYD